MRLQLREARQWHDQRDELLRLRTELAIVTETVGKIARDVALPSQAEVGEMLESPPTKGVGGWSAMPTNATPWPVFRPWPPPFAPPASRSSRPR